jgi:predicted GH43/DUF377 family glycosyl hydrolase
MKTNEQITKEVINYLDKTSNHVFLKPKSSYDWNTTTYRYDYENSTYFKVFKKEDGYYILEDDKVRKFDHEYYIKYCGNNTKNVIKHSLFLNKKMKGGKNTKYVQSKIEEFLVKG